MDQDHEDGQDPQNCNGDVVDNRPCCAVVLAHQVDEEKWTKVPQAIGHPDRHNKGNDETFLCD